LDRKALWVLASVVALSLVPLAAPLAGEYSKCTMSTQDCLDKMVSSFREHGWVGIEMEVDDETGVRTIIRVVPNSPAEKGGFQAGDVLVALNGIRFGKENDEMLMKVRKKQMKPGNEVTYTVARAGYERQIPVTLATAPPDVLASWIGRHMLEHVSQEVAKK
jgi:predicted metalloprotease with PDZ domain